MITELGQTVDEIKNYPNMHSFAINYFDDCQTQISFEIDDPNTIWISTLYTTSRGNPYPTPSNKTECLGKGSARKMMQIFCDLADKYKVKLHMNASPIGEKHMSGKQLHNFYSSFVSILELVSGRIKGRIFIVGFLILRFSFPYIASVSYRKNLRFDYSSPTSLFNN